MRAWRMPGDVTEDFDGIPRPQGAGWDIGALEFFFSVNRVTVEDVPALAFTSSVGHLYGLEFNTNGDTNVWTDAGALLTGDGSTMFMFDPSGFSTQKNYRIIHYQ